MRKQATRSEPGKRPVQQAVNCEKAQVMVSEFDFKEIKAEFCEGCDSSFQRDQRWKVLLHSNNSGQWRACKS
jgi:hypothetical protein